MKFTIAALVLAFAYIANAHTVVDIAKYHSPVGHHGPALVNSHGGYGGGYGGGYDGGYGGGYNGGYGHGWDVGHPHGAPHITLHTSGWGYGADGAGAGAGADGGHGHGHHDGKYIASNRGAVHVAPLVGHIQSVKSNNDQPAPGTTW